MAHSKKRSTASQPEKAPEPLVLATAAEDPSGLKTALMSKKFLLAGLTFLLALGGYFFTFARTVTLVDSGELILTSAQARVAHPPGFPLYTMFGYLFPNLPIGSRAAHISFMSSVFAAVAAAMLALITVQLQTDLAHSPRKVKEKRKAGDKSAGIYAGDAVSLAVLSRFFAPIMPIAVGLP